MSRFAAIIIGIFIYAGARMLLPSLITGTTTGELVILAIVPITLSVVVTAVVAVRLFK